MRAEDWKYLLTVVSQTIRHVLWLLMGREVWCSQSIGDTCRWQHWEGQWQNNRQRIADTADIIWLPLSEITEASLSHPLTLFVYHLLSPDISLSIHFSTSDKLKQSKHLISNALLMQDDLEKYVTCMGVCGCVYARVCVPLYMLILVFLARCHLRLAIC